MNGSLASWAASRTPANKWTASISFRFLRIVFVILFICSLATTTIISLNQNATLERYLSDKATNLGAYVAKLSKDPLLLDDSIPLDAIVREAIKDEDIIYTYIRNKNGLVVTSQFAGIDYQWLEKRSLVTDLPPDATVAEIARAIKMKVDILEITVPIQEEFQAIGTVTVGISKHRINAQTLRTLLFTLGINLMAACAVGAALFIVSRKMILGPIVELTRATRRLAKGDLTTRVEIKATGEVQLLIDCFNRMSEDLEETTVSREYVDNIIESMIDTLIVVSPEGMILRSNSAACALLGFGEAGLAGLPVETIILSGVPHAASLLDEVRAKGCLGATEMACLAKDGRRIPVLVSAAAMHRNGAIQGIVCVAQDISERKEAELKLHATQAELVQNHEELKGLYHQLETQSAELHDAYAELKTTQVQLLQREKMASIGQLAAGVAHEINNPIGFIHCNLGTLGRYVGRLTGFMEAQTEMVNALVGAESHEVLAAERKEKKVDYIVEDIERLIAESLEGAQSVKRIVQDLKSFSRLDEAEEQTADINAGLESAINMVWNELKYKASLRRELGELPRITCYPGQLNQVFMNLLVNAVHAIENQGEITVRTRHEGGSIVVSISDNGCGIPEPTLQRIFDPFFTTKEVGQGTGLGLSIAFNIIKKHRGEITVESTVGMGTTFHVILPVA